MKLTVIPSDGAVYVDGQAYLEISWEGTPVDVHALQWFGSNGWIEYKGDTPNEAISVLPEWANNAYAAWVVANTPPPPEPILPTTAGQNKDLAIMYLQETDWSVLPGIADPLQSNPYLANQQDFIAYRNQVRNIAVNPVDGDIVFPTKPQASWVSI